MYRSGMPAQLFIGSKPCRRLFRPVSNYGNSGLWGIMCKPIGGIWTSTLEGECGSDWVRWNHGSQGVDEWRGYVLYPLKRARVFEINSQKDYEWLLNHYGYTFPSNPNGTHNANWMVLDFEKLAQKCDGLHLSKRGQRATNYYEPRTRLGFTPPALTAWDCESTVWFRWVFSNKIGFEHGIC